MKLIMKSGGYWGHSVNRYTENILKRRTSKNPKSRGVNEMPLKAEDMKY